MNGKLITATVSVLCTFVVTALPFNPLQDLWSHENAQTSRPQTTENSLDRASGATGSEPAAAPSGTSQFLRHGVCLLWDQSLLLLHVISDSLIALAFYSIPVALIFFVRKRKDLAFSWIFVLFASFMIACGTTHFLGIWMIGRPAYWLDGIVKALTATGSIITAILLWPLIPNALRLPVSSGESSCAPLPCAMMNSASRSRTAASAFRLKTPNGCSWSPSNSILPAQKNIPARVWAWRWLNESSRRRHSLWHRKVRVESTRWLENCRYIYRLENKIVAAPIDAAPGRGR
jgi:hypothetical protein